MPQDTISPVFISILTNALQLSSRQISNTIQLLQGGATIPFISRYRKEMTGELDEVQVGAIKDQYDKLIEIEKRKETILKTINELGKLTPELKNRIDTCWNQTELEDIYLPYKPKRRTRAEIAREHGLEPLAKMIMKQNADDLDYLAKPYVKDKIKSIDDALNGASDIIAEWINEDEKARNVIRRIFTYEAIITSKLIKGKEEEAQKYRDYFDMSEKLSKCSSHRLLAMRRGESEGFLRVNISPNEDTCMEKLASFFVRANNASGDLVYTASQDAFKRLLKPSIENEFAAESKLKADTEAIRVFAENLRQLLLAPPLGEKRVLGIDPGFRTGCKVVCIDAQGNLLHNETIYPNPPQNEYAKASRSIQKSADFCCQ